MAAAEGLRTAEVERDVDGVEIAPVLLLRPLWGPGEEVRWTVCMPILLPICNARRDAMEDAAEFASEATCDLAVICSCATMPLPGSETVCGEEAAIAASSASPCRVSCGHQLAEPFCTLSAPTAMCSTCTLDELSELKSSSRDRLLEDRCA